MLSQSAALQLDMVMAEAVLLLTGQLLLAALVLPELLLWSGKNESIDFP
jgi:hypothetical protein